MWLVQTALAGPAAGVTASLGAALDRADRPALGAITGFYAGYRVDLGPLHLQPELVGRWNGGAAGAAALVLGGAVTVFNPVRVGAYVHTGFGAADGRSVSDAGVMAELALPGPLAVGLRAGWQKDDPAVRSPAENWLQVGLTAGLDF